jgi:hypothetical protein
MHSNRLFETVKISFHLSRGLGEGGGRWAVIVGSVDREHKRVCFE